MDVGSKEGPQEEPTGLFWFGPQSPDGTEDLHQSGHRALLDRPRGAKPLTALGTQPDRPGLHRPNDDPSCLIAAVVNCKQNLLMAWKAPLEVENERGAA